MAISKETSDRLIAAIAKVSSEVGAKTKGSEETAEAFMAIMNEAIVEGAEDVSLTELQVSRRTTSVNRLPAFLGVPNIDIRTALTEKPAGASVIYAIFRPAGIPFPVGNITFISGAVLMDLINLDGSITMGLTSISAGQGEILSFANDPTGTRIEVTRIR